MESKNYYIGEVAKQLAVSQRTIRYYEELGFIEAGRTQGQFRVYSQLQVNRLKTILHLKELGVPLKEIGALLKLGNKGSVQEVSPALCDALIERKKEFETKLERYREGIKEIEGVLSLIEHCIKCRKQTDQDVCHHCIDEHEADMPQLMKGLL